MRELKQKINNWLWAVCENFNIKTEKSVTVEKWKYLLTMLNQPLHFLILPWLIEKNETIYEDYLKNK